MRIKRHTEEEIAAKLRQAEEIAAQGKTQKEIARALGISVMTFHRWRKRREGSPVSSSRDRRYVSDPTVVVASSRRVRELEVENLRLRRLVADLMLRKLELEEVWQRLVADQAAK
jgi:transposase-like protein